MQSPAAQPYRVHASAVVVPPRPRRPLAPREVLAVGASVFVADVLLLEGDHVAAGGPFLAALFALAAVALVRARPAGSSLCAPVRGLVVMLGAVVVRTAVDPTPLTTIAGWVTLFTLAVATRRPRSLGPRLVASAARIFPALPSRLGALRVGAKTLAGDRLRGGMLSVGIAVSLSAVFAAVFALANPVVEGVVLRGLAALQPASLFIRLAVWPLAALVALMLVRPPVALLPKTGPADEAPSSTWTSTAELSLVCLNLMFLAYLALDLGVLATGHAPDGVSTQDYAHRGAIWLTVAMLMLTMVVALFFHGPLGHAREGQRARRLATVWIALGAALAVATYGRIGIHIHHSGLSDLRIVGVLGTTLVLIGMLLAARRLHGGHSTGWMLGRQLEAFLLVVALYAVAPTHWVSACWNVHRIQNGAVAPLLHVRAQSREVESVTAFLPLLDHPDPRVRVGVAAFLLDSREALREDLAEGGQGWRSFRPLATWRTADLARAEMSVDDSLDGVSCADSEWGASTSASSAWEAQDARSEWGASASNSARRCAQNALDQWAYSE